MTKKSEDRYCVWTKTHYTGNAMIFWRDGGSGYTCFLDEAWVMPKSKADEICRMRPDEDIPVAFSALDSRAKRIVDIQLMPPTIAKIKAAR